MKRFVDKEELNSLFTGLANDNREYVLAIARALTFAQNAVPKPPLDDDENAKSA